MPLDLVVYEAKHFKTDKIVCIDENNPYFKMVHNTWGLKLREMFDSIEEPIWDGGKTDVPVVPSSGAQPTAEKNHQPEEKLI